jgi:hypothetical protein
MTNSPDISRPNPGEVKGTDLTKEQLASASDFLTALGWTESEPIRQATRERVALLIAWYGALRYQAAAHQLGSYEAPGRLIATTQKKVNAARTTTTPRTYV